MTQREADGAQAEDPRGGRSTVHSRRPWGDIHIVVRNQPCSVDLTEVRAGVRSSLHSHRERHELFHILTPGACIEIDGEVFRPQPHDEFLIKPGQQHRFWSESDGFRMLVVSFGHWTAEDQIRHEDDFGRQGQPLTVDDFDHGEA